MIAPRIARTRRGVYRFDPAIYCPRCGHRGIWYEDGPGDYYQGPICGCAACGGEGSGWLDVSGAHEWLAAAMAGPSEATA